VLVTWGLVPTQAGIFSIKVVVRTTNITFTTSTSSLPFENQASGLTFRYMQSAYGIVALNETLPGYMTRNYALAPFRPRDDQVMLSGRGNHTAPTTMYKLDLHCEKATEDGDVATSGYFTSSLGCRWSGGGVNGNITMDDPLGQKVDHRGIRQYIGMYVGYHNGGFADYYMSGGCPDIEPKNSTFYLAFTKTKVNCLTITSNACLVKLT